MIKTARKKTINHHQKNKNNETVNQKIGHSTIVHGTIEMFIPEGGSHVRQALIFMPVIFTEDPTVTVTVYTTVTAVVVGVWGNEKVQAKGQYEVRVSAANVVSGEKVNEGYFCCNYVIIGT